MKPDERFRKQPKYFWANVRTISQEVGYTSGGQIKVPTFTEMTQCLMALGLETHHILEDLDHPTEFGRTLFDYFTHRAKTLNDFVEHHLMDVDQARDLYESLVAKYSPKRPAPMNKQKADKKAPAYLTAIINMLIEAHIQGFPCDYDPRSLTTVTFNKMPVRTLARRVDGCFPSTVNPLAVWEIKEYYYTTTFGSRVADGIYETLLDGMELEELYEHEKVEVKHYLMVDSHFTWWKCGRSYLCRIIDMLHMGYVDEVLFGREVVDRLPVLVKEWVETAKQQGYAPL